MKKLEVKKMENIEGGELSGNTCAAVGAVTTGAIVSGNAAVAIFGFAVYVGGGCSS